MQKLSLISLLAAALGGCASYQPLALPEAPAWQQARPDLQIDVVKLGFPALPPHSFAPGPAGLDMTDVAILAVLNNGDLKLARDDAGVAQAQAFAASLLPDPQLAASADFKLHPDAGSTRGFSLGPSFDFGSLLTHDALTAAGRHDAAKADLNLLWQEWQVIAQARVLTIRVVESERLLALLEPQQQALAQRLAQLQQALAQGLVTVDTHHAMLATQLDLQKQLADSRRANNQARHDLNTLLGLAPSEVLPLDPALTLEPVDAVAVRGMLPRLAQRRPDLLALQRGYLAQDSRYRAAIIAQFPALTIGFTRARDTSNVASHGFGVTMGLPLWNRNRGNIAIEQATRQRLHDEYQQRLNTAYADVDRLLAEQALNVTQLDGARQGLAQLQQQRQAAQQAFAAGNLDGLAMSALDSAVTARSADLISLEQSLLEQRVALMSVIGGTLPAPLRTTTP